MRYGAFGLVEVVGSSNAVIVIDQMLKTADVSFLTRNGKCGGHETVFVTGDVSAVTAAVQAVKENPPCDVVFRSRNLQSIRRDDPSRGGRRPETRIYEKN